MTKSLDPRSGKIVLTFYVQKKTAVSFKCHNSF